MIPKVQPTFTQNNQLRIEISNHNFNHGEFKLCFSLVYSILSIEGAEIYKQIGRYYEIKTYDNVVFITLQRSRIGSYNLSCGPEGTFIINNKDQHVEVDLELLKFETNIPSNKYENEKPDKFNPIIPEPAFSEFKNIFVELEDLKIKIDKNDINFFETFSSFSKILNINFNTKSGIQLIFNKFDLKNAHLIIDGNFSLNYKSYKEQSIIKGDNKSLSIAAASIIAKVHRDRLMKKLSIKFQDFGWEKNAGYGTKMHIENIHRLGPTIHHRKTFEPIKSLIHN